MTHNEAFVTLSSDGSMNTQFDVDYVAYTPVEGMKHYRHHVVIIIHFITAAT